MPAPTPVLYVNHVSILSGAEESLLTLLSRLDREKVRPVLACPPGELAARAKQLGVEIHPLPMQRFRLTANPLTVSAYAFAWMTAGSHLKRIIQAVSPKLIHANSAHAQLYAASVAEKAGIPCVWHSRDLRPLPFPALSLCRSADRVIAISEAVADFLAASGLIRPKVTRIYNGIDPDAWRGRVTGKDVRAELGLAANERILLMAAQMAPWKRHEDAIRTLQLVLPKEPRARLVIAGSDRFEDNPELLPKLEILATELGVRDKVVFAGQRNDIPDLMSAAEIIIIPSDAEPFGRAAIEAMSLGKPVVGTRAGGLPEVVRDGETGLLAVPRFPESLAAACLRILQNESLARSLGEAGRHRVQTQFHIDRAAEETQTLYAAMLHPPLRWIRK